MNGNRVLVEAALKAVSGSGFSSTAGECQRWVRQVVQSRYKQQFDGYWRGSAKETAAAFKGTRYAVTGAPQPGDLLYKTSGKYGHVGIYVGHGLVAENSSTTIGRVSGARGLRTLARYGRVDILVRLPLPSAEAARLVSGPHGQAFYWLEDDSAVVGLRDAAEVLGAKLDTADWPLVVVNPLGTSA